MSTDQPTIVGGRGMIGGYLSAVLRQHGHEPVILTHEQLDQGARPRGVVFYLSGLTWGAERSPVEARRIHVDVPRRFLERCRPERFLYASSTRVYDLVASTEERRIGVRREHGVYAHTKLEGEQVTLDAGGENRVLRFSNIVGLSKRAQVFHVDILRQAATTGVVTLHTSPASSKDYLAAANAASLIADIAARSMHRIYNVASGVNISHQQWLEAIRVYVPDLQVIVDEGAPTIHIREIDVSRVASEFAFTPESVLESVPEWLAFFRKSM